MPLSHLGLTVSHVPAATSFYLAALHPLGYRYIAQRGIDVGLGITEADFFLRPAQHGYVCSSRGRTWNRRTHGQYDRSRPAPVHIAFAADTRTAVRNCYVAALNAGARSSGRPDHRQDDRTYFNAAVEDPDGNTVEFVFQEPRRLDQVATTIPKASHISETPGSMFSARPRQYVDACDAVTSKYHSAANRALDLASPAVKSVRQDSPKTGTRCSRTDPSGSAGSVSGDAIIGTLIGAAAGVAVTYGVARLERSTWTGIQPRHTSMSTPDHRRPSRVSEAAASSRGGAKRYTPRRSNTSPSALDQEHTRHRRLPSSAIHTVTRRSLNESELERDSGVDVRSHQSRKSSKAGTARIFRRGETGVGRSAREGHSDAVAEADGLGDLDSVVPDDSISRVDCFGAGERGTKDGAKSVKPCRKRRDSNIEQTTRPSRSVGSRHTARYLPIRAKTNH